MGNYGVCVCFTRKFKSDALSPPGDVKDLFNEYSESGGKMTVKSLHRFLLEVQGQNDATEKDAEHVIEVLRQRRHVSVFQCQGLHLYGFFQFLFSKDLNPVINSKVWIEAIYDCCVSIAKKFSILPQQTLPHHAYMIT